MTLPSVPRGLGAATVLLSLLGAAGSSHGATLDEMLHDGARIEDVVIGGELTPADSVINRMTVYLTVPIGNGMASICTGTLIAKDMVLTAAHCLTEVSSVSMIRLTALQNSGFPEQENFFAESFKIHEGYQRHGTSKALFDLVTVDNRPVNDIALIKVIRPVFSRSQIASLPEREPQIGETKAVLIAGFGKTIATDDRSTGRLHFAWTQARVVRAPKDDVQWELEGAQTCHGDSGGPAFVKSGKDFVVVGVTSHGKKNCTQMRSTSVAHHLEWIKRTAAEMRKQRSL